MNYIEMVMNSTKTRRSLEYKVLMPTNPLSNSRAAQKWCEETFGKKWCALTNKEGEWTVFWAGRDNPSSYEFYFAEEKHKIWFMMRWL